MLGGDWERSGRRMPPSMTGPPADFDGRIGRSVVDRVSLYSGMVFQLRAVGHRQANDFIHW